MKIILGFLQISSIIVTVVVVKWPTAFLDFINAFSFLNLDFVPWQSVGCISSFDFYTKMIVVCLTPLGVRETYPPLPSPYPPDFFPSPLFLSYSLY